MGHIAIKLNPAELSNPDLDLRYQLPELIETNTAGQVRDDGFDYGEDDSLLIYLSCDDPSVQVHTVIELLNENQVCDNFILKSAIIGISEDERLFQIVYPTSMNGEFTVRPW